jgi:hypothetical protein
MLQPDVPARSAGTPWRRSFNPQAWSEATIVFVIFLLVQIVDGLLTYVGVRLFGNGVEANLILSTWMDLIGAPGALIGAKLLACGCGYILYRTAWHRPLAITAGLCLGVAVIPWVGVMAEVLLTR